MRKSARIEGANTFHSHHKNDLLSYTKKHLPWRGSTNLNFGPPPSKAYSTDRTMSQIFHRMCKCEAFGWRFHRLPNMVMRRSPVARSGKIWSEIDFGLILQIFSLVKHLISIQISFSKTKISNKQIGLHFVDFTLCQSFKIGVV
jgi:hypothetical protein